MRHSATVLERIESAQDAFATLEAKVRGDVKPRRRAKRRK